AVSAGAGGPPAPNRSSCFLSRRRAAGNRAARGFAQVGSSRVLRFPTTPLAPCPAPLPVAGAGHGAASGKASRSLRRGECEILFVPFRVACLARKELEVEPVDALAVDAERSSILHHDTFHLAVPAAQNDAVAHLELRGAPPFALGSLALLGHKSVP